MKRELYPENWEEIAEKIKKAAGYKCENCESPSQTGKILTVHHIIDNKMDCSDNNLVALCQVCHLHFQARYRPGQTSLFPKPEWQIRRGL